MVAFEMAYKKTKVESFLNLFRHYYHIKRTGGFYSVCGRSLSMDFLIIEEAEKVFYGERRKLSEGNEMERKKWERSKA